MDDEQGPWWTRPPEPGPRVHLRDEDRDTKTSTSRDSGTSAEDSGNPDGDPYDTEIFRPEGGQHPIGQQGGWPDATPVPQPPQDPYVPQAHQQQPAAGQDALTMPLPLIEEDLSAPPADATQPNPAVPAPPVKKAKPVIRRVAAPEPPARPRPKPIVPADRNAYAPPQNGDIWATFSGPIPLPDEVLAQRGQAPQKAAAPPPPPRPEPAAAGDGDSQSPLKKFFAVQLPEARFVLIAIAGGLVVLLIVLVALLSGGGGPGDDKSEPEVSPSGLSGMAAQGIGEVKPVDAAAMLQRADANAGGDVVEAYEWLDKNGKNLIAAIEIPAAKNKTTLKVVHVVGLDGGDPKVRRSMTDPDLPQCEKGKRGGTAGFSSDGMLIRDLDSNGYAEVLVGWSSRCGGEGSESQAKLALLSDGEKYIVRGAGVLGSGAGNTEPDPAVKKWPDTFYDTTSQRYGELFFPVSK